MILGKIFRFDSAHKLPLSEGKCKNLHGHTWKLIIEVEGEPDNKGMIIDFNELKKIVNKKVIEKLDHTYLNEIIQNPTCENILLWIKEQLKELKVIRKIILYETENNFCEIFFN